jgi:hypothetical protein
MYLIWILTLVSNSKLLKRNSKSFSIFQAAQIGFGPNSLEAWSIFPPSPAQLHLAHFGPVRPTSPSSSRGSGGPLFPFGPTEACSLFSFLRPNARAATASCATMGCPHVLGGRGSEAPPMPLPFPSSSGTWASPLPLLFGFKTVGIENPPPVAALPSPTPHFVATAYIKHSEDPRTMPPLSCSSSPSPGLSSAPPPPSSGRHLGSLSPASLLQCAAHSHPRWGPPGAPLPFPQLTASSHSPERPRAWAPVSPPPLPCSSPWWTESATGPRDHGNGSWLFAFRNNSKSYNSRSFL